MSEDALYPHRGGWRHAVWCDGPRWPENRCPCGLDEARAALSGVPEGAASDRGFAADRPNGPRTQVGHALASTLRRALPDRDTDWDQWVRDIEAAALRPVPSPEPLEPMCMSCGATESYRCAECGSDDPTGYSLSRLAAPQPVPEDET